MAAWNEEKPVSTRKRQTEGVHLLFLFSLTKPYDKVRKMNSFTAREKNHPEPTKNPPPAKM